MSKTMAVDVRYKSLYISLPSSAKNATWNDQILRCLENINHNDSVILRISQYLELNAFVACSAGASFNTDKHTEILREILK